MPKAGALCRRQERVAEWEGFFPLPLAGSPEKILQFRNLICNFIISRERVLVKNLCKVSYVFSRKQMEF